MRKRRRARELVLRELYGWEISGNSIDIVLENLKTRGSEDEDVIEFASLLLQKATENKEELDADVAIAVENWDFKRIALLDRLVLRMALCELLFFDEIPPKVSINEAIELAKTYSTDKSGVFVNGILDALYQKYKSENRIQKKGRGLLNQRNPV